MEVDLSLASEQDVHYALSLADASDAPFDQTALDTLARFGFQSAMFGDAEAAIYPLIQVVNAAPRVAKYRAALGVAYARSNRVAEGLNELRQSLALEPNNLEVHCIVGELLLDKLDYSAAAKAFARCLELDPRAEHPAGIRARALIKKGEKLLKQAIESK